jgi:hypothetical protein
MLTWLPAEKFPHLPAARTNGEVGSCWYATFRNSWPSHLTVVQDLGSDVDGAAFDGYRVTGTSVLLIFCPRLTYFCYIFARSQKSTQTANSDRIPFALAPNGATLQLLEQILSRCCAQLDPQCERPPPQDLECMDVASLNLFEALIAVDSASRPIRNRS